MRGKAWICVWLLGLWLLGCPAVLCAQGNAKAENLEPEPIFLGITDSAEITLSFLDVEVYDSEGNPVPGLTKDDFAVRMAWASRPIYSVDDLCSPAPEGSALEAARAVGAVDARRFILYFDFSQLQIDGRVRALEQATRWAREIKQDGDEAMVVGNSTHAGLHVFSEFTKSREQTITAIAEAAEVSGPLETFADQLANRQLLCRGAENSTCGAGVEYTHARRALRSLTAFLISIQRDPVRKHLLLFHQNYVVNPDSLYRDKDRETWTFDFVSLIDEIGAESTAARTSIHVLYSGNRQSGGGGFGANLSDVTGGFYNRGPADLEGTVSAIGEMKPCTYRIGLEPWKSKMSGVFRATIFAGNEALPHRYSVRFMSELDRWIRKARFVLANPEIARDVTFSAAIIPVRLNERGWDARVQVAIDLDSISLLPSGPLPLPRANLVVGALLLRGADKKGRGMLGLSQARFEGDRDIGITVLHENEFERLRGSYDLRVFVRNRVANLFGGARDLLYLPDPRFGGLVGPLALESQPRVLAPLPLDQKKRRRRVSVEPTAVTEVAVGLVPIRTEVEPGTRLVFQSWLCPDPDEDPNFDTFRFVTLDDRPIFRFEEPEITNAGQCVRVVDKLDTRPMGVGEYTYYIAWRRFAERDAIQSDVSFRILEGVSSPEITAERAESPGSESQSVPTQN